MITWGRWYHGTTSDPKWRVVAKKTGQPVAIIVAIWAAIFENASASEDRGTLSNWNTEDVATALDLTIETVETVCNAMQQKVLNGDHLTAWEKRNPKRERDDDSTQRVQRFREKQKLETPRNAKKRLDKIREEKSRKEEIRPEEEKKGTQPRDAAMDAFTEAHSKNFNSEYSITGGDATQLASLRKVNHVPARASPEGWPDAVENYFASPLDRYTLADLSRRFGVFRNSRLDRFGKPVSHIHATGGNDGKTKTDRNREAAERLRARLNSADSSSSDS